MKKDLNMVHGGLPCIIGGLVFLVSLLCVAEELLVSWGQNFNYAYLCKLTTCLIKWSALGHDDKREKN
jgi:hypothetical protein